MKIRDLIVNLLKYDIDLDVFLVNGNDLMSPSVTTEAVVKNRSIGIPPKLYDTDMVGNSGEQHIEPNALILMWM